MSNIRIETTDDESSITLKSNRKIDEILMVMENIWITKDVKNVDTKTLTEDIKNLNPEEIVLVMAKSLEYIKKYDKEVLK